MSDEKTLDPGVEEFTTAESEKDGARKITLQYNFGASLDDSTAKFGAEVVHGMFVKAAKIALQVTVRRMLADPEQTDDKIAKFVSDEWKPGVRQPRASAAGMDKVVSRIAKLPKDKQIELLAQLAKQLGIDTDSSPEVQS